MRELILKDYGSRSYSNRKRVRVTSSEINKETIAWISGVHSKGGTASAKAVYGLDMSIRLLKTSNLWSNILMFYPMIGDQWAAMWTPVVGAQWTDGTTALNHTTAYSESVGLTGDGAGWVNSNCNQNTLSTTNNSVCIYGRDSVGLGTSMSYFGASVTGNVSYSNFKKHNTLGTQIILNSGTPQGAAYLTDMSAAFWCGTRTAANDARLYRNKTSVYTNGTTGAQPYTWSDLNNYIMARNNNGTADEKANGLILAGIIVLKQGMSQTDVDNIYAAFKLWNDSIGRTGL